MKSFSLNWPRFVAGVLVVVTGLQLCSGAMVTTYDAAMAVPDWPSTYGHNMFLFPLRDWLGGPFDLMLEHGHRLWGTVVGLLTLVLAAVCWRQPVTPAVRSLAVAAVALVILQGLVGGFRVLLDSQTVAKVHACAGPLFFAVVVAIAALSRRGVDAAVSASPLAVRAGIGLVVAAYLQLVAGAQLRHLDAAVDPRSFHGLVGLHLVGALAVAVLAAVAVAATRVAASRGAWGWSRVILFLVGCQVVLGGGAWVAKYGPPSALLPEAWRLSAPLVARSGAGAIVVTAHALLGMLILGAAVALAIASGALARSVLVAPGRGRSGAEAFA
jgi:cytochrome c oxidase assembly protein subunit 15